MENVPIWRNHLRNHYCWCFGNLAGRCAIMMTNILWVIAYLVLAPVIGGLLAGIDRVITARMQGRFGPPVLQPFYVLCFFIFVVITGCFFFAGGDLLLVIFALTLASVFLIIAAFSSNSPYAQIGAERELLQMMAYEPMVLMTAVGFYMFTGSFRVSGILSFGTMPFLYMIGIFIGFVFILTIKFRKSPFDLSMSHHAHQELVKGLTTEFSGKTLALIEVAHWYENIFLLGFIFLFFANGTAFGTVLGLGVCLVTYFLEVLIDNSFARMKWQFALKSSWIIAITVGFINLVVLRFMP